MQDPKAKKAQRKRANLQLSTRRDLEQPVTLVGSTTPSPSSWPLGPRRGLILFKISYRTLVLGGRVVLSCPSLRPVLCRCCLMVVTMSKDSVKIRWMTPLKGAFLSTYSYDEDADLPPTRHSHIRVSDEMTSTRSFFRQNGVVSEP